MVVAFDNLNSYFGLKKLDEFLLAHSYITGYQASKDDIIRISGVSGEGTYVIVEGSAPITEVVPDSKASATAEEDELTVLTYLLEGLTFGASKLVPAGYAIKKLQIMLTIVDDLVSMDDLLENYLTVEPINDFEGNGWRSVDIFSCQKELNKAAILNMCWGTKQKQDRLWMKLIHNYYIRRQSMNELRVPTQTCWMVRKVLGAKDSLHLLHNASGGKRSKTRLAYNQMLRNYPKVYCRGLICCNSARPKAIFKL
ncbi:hypothetical protein KY289_029269 [Solanum tuberosum]|nr:hypothetical protein KY289_029269 [Solanum tuberosum]